jgi:hypothetical protein
MKRRTQSNIDEVQQWADKLVAGVRHSLTKDGDAKSQPKVVTWTASKMRQRTELAKDLVERVLVKGDWLLNKFNHDLLCELAALALERGDLPPKPLCEYAAEVLRQDIKKQRGTLQQRDGQIAHLLVQLRKQNIPLFPNRDVGRRPGRTYGCDIVVNAFKNAGVHLSPATVENVWRNWSPVLRT